MGSTELASPTELAPSEDGRERRRVPTGARLSGSNRVKS